ncbi:hypothetical protein LTR62_000196 [Meristemomyces frigidus]|uniref:AAA+ ATPase domain-containing protein n=1 Tax=Meristemomyces frigidus TaxID=1508187 RepID=A0AAN7TK68_9PEZI|nr:hypothetical protein LTR62_000196 [Meristemomyces frigidus]
MAATAIWAAMSTDGAGSVHPFFRRGNGTHNELPGPDFVDEVEEQSTEVEHYDGSSEEKPRAKRSRKSKAQLEADSDGKKQKTLLDLVKPKALLSTIAPSNLVQDLPALVSSDPAVKTSRRKRRRISHPESDHDEDFQDVANPASSTTWSTTDQIDYTAPARYPSSPRVIIPASSPVAASPTASAAVNATTEQTTIRPKKVLRLNASGKFSSPVTRKQMPEKSCPASLERKGRPRKSRNVTLPQQMMVVVSYGITGSGMGTRINRILTGEARTALESPHKATQKKPRTPRKSNKLLHPLFGGKPKEQPKPMKLESPKRLTATTPGKLRRQILADRPPDLRREVPYAIGSALLKDRLMVKHPGAKEPLWPNRQSMHVRGLAIDNVLSGCAIQSSLTDHKRKRKVAQMPFQVADSVLHRFGAKLRPEPERALRMDGLQEPPQALRVPARLLITGQQIRQRITTELQATLNGVDLAAQSKLQLTPSPQITHPSLLSLWGRIPHTLSAFDELRGENVSWPQKYAPQIADTVLQPAHEMQVLKSWLTSLTVTAVEQGGPPNVKAPVMGHVRPRKKRTRKLDDLDDFLVDDDSIVRDMDELADPEDPPVTAGSAKGLRSIVQSGVQGTKLSNAILLSGPSGCGKTAAAYAVARELGFKVFEISPCERRSGKDVLDKIGDMTENHLVRHHGLDAGELSRAEEPNKELLEEAFQRDLASGRHGKMNTFFTPQVAAKKAAVPRVKAMTSKAQAKPVDAIEQVLKKPPKNQQQSLILLEEVDILFKDDKEFWNTIFRLILSSKRPFIMTCNDEDMVPLQAMDLHAILRFTPPPTDLATDYLLLLAASEGHVLKRAAVTRLYEAKDRDLRASITELDFWCQMAVGDPKGGLGWIYQRWPLGSDVDHQGLKLRVVSDGTYQQGVGSSSEAGLGKQDQILWAWQEHGVDPTTALTLRALHDANEFAQNPVDRLASLKWHSRYADTVSALAEFASPAFAEETTVDTTTPEMPDKARHHYIEGLPLLQTDECADYEHLSQQMVVASVSALARSRESIHTTSVHEQAPRPIYPSSPPLTRQAFAVFDPISTAPDAGLTTTPNLLQSVFDCPLSILATDLAPYVRSIVQYDLALEDQRDRLDHMIGAEGIEGRKSKRARTTRAARSAVEGSQRASTRRERWFDKRLDLPGVLRTGGAEWPKTVLGWPASTAAGSVDGSDAPASSGESAAI